MKPTTALLFKLQGVADEVSRKLIVKYWLEYHLPDGTTLDYRRPVELCNDRFCTPKKDKCVMHKEFQKYDFCISV